MGSDEMHVSSGDYGRKASRSTNVPLFSEYKDFFREYSDVVIFHFEKKYGSLKIALYGRERSIKNL